MASDVEGKAKKVRPGAVPVREITSGVRAIKLREAPTPAICTTRIVRKEEREGWTPLDRPPPGGSSSPGADTAGSIERKVVSGHAYAILAPHTADGGRCGYDKPTNLSVDGVFDL
jgi:hypothetical protein